MTTCIGTPFFGARIAGSLSLFLFAAGLCSASTISETGTLTNPENTFLTTINLATTGGITLQTYGFGGGANKAGHVISAGGFDSFVGLYSGTGPTALFLDGTADNLSNYSSEPSACSPAGLVTIGSVAGQCGDVKLQFTGLAAGTYTILLSDANYIPNAVYETKGYLGDGFTDFTAGVFQTCYDASDCNTDTANWALDITTPGNAPTSTPEPASLALLGLGLAIASRVSFRKRRP